MAFSLWQVFLPLLAISHLTFADEAEIRRLKGFYSHRANELTFDQERERGRDAHNEEFEQWEQRRQASIQDYKKQAKLQSPDENSKEYREHLLDKKAQEKQYEIARQQFSALQAQVRSRKFSREGLVTPEEELGLPLRRPRYLVQNRALYGAKRKSGTATPSFGSLTGGWSGGGSSSGGGDNNFPPPPPPIYDEGGSDGFIPPPPPPIYDEGSDFPPPPPPPGGFDDGGFSPPPLPDDFGDFVPPPPPPPAFGEGF